MAERNEAVVKHVVGLKPSDGDAHSISRVAIQPRLGTIHFFPHNDRSRGSGVKLKFLWQRRERSERFANILDRSRLNKFHPYCRQMAVSNIDTMTLGAHCHGGFFDSCTCEHTKNLQCFLFDLLFFALDEGQYIVADSERRNTRIT